MPASLAALGGTNVQLAGSNILRGYLLEVRKTKGNAVKAEEENVTESVLHSWCIMVCAPDSEREGTLGIAVTFMTFRSRRQAPGP
jgi:hypothetical protein